MAAAVRTASALRLFSRFADTASDAGFCRGAGADCARSIVTDLNAAGTGAATGEWFAGASWAHGIGRQCGDTQRTSAVPRLMARIQLQRTVARKLCDTANSRLNTINISAPINLSRPRHHKRRRVLYLDPMRRAPARQGPSRCFDTSLSSPMPQSARNRSGPISPCSNCAMKMPSLRRRGAAPEWPSGLRAAAIVAIARELIEACANAAPQSRRYHLRQEPRLHHR
jgi:hypothetical protein